MSPAKYAHRCGLAKALELVGERWTMLIVRELLAGPRRYKDIQDGVPGLATNVLSTRLRTLEEWRVVRRRRLDPPASVDVYELDEEGRALLPAVRELTRWGMRHLDASAEGLELRATWLVTAMHAQFDAAQVPPGTDATIGFELDGEHLWARLRDGGLEAGMGEVEEPRVRIAAPLALFVDVSEGRVPLAEALSRGAIVEGDLELAMELPRIFPAAREPEPVR